MSADNIEWSRNQSTSTKKNVAENPLSQWLREMQCQEKHKRKSLKHLCLEETIQVASLEKKAFQYLCKSHLFCSIAKRRGGISETCLTIAECLNVQNLGRAKRTRNPTRWPAPAISIETKGCETTASTKSRQQNKKALPTTVGMACGSNSRIFYGIHIEWTPW